MFSTIIRFFIFVSIFSLLFSCMDANQINEAKKKSDTLLEKIATGNALSEFPEKYFNQEQTKLILNKIKNNCDFANRKGNFINDFTLNQNGINRVAFIYEYYLKCDSIRFILTYNLGKELELYEFKLEGIEKNNFMITSPEKRLKFQ